jgi:hypothetical protein
VIGGLETLHDRESSAEFVIRAPCLEGIRTLLRGEGCPAVGFLSPYVHWRTVLFPPQSAGQIHRRPARGILSVTERQIALPSHSNREHRRAGAATPSQTT